MSTKPIFTFPGLWPYIERASEGRDAVFLGRGRGLWHYKQVQDALGQLPTLPPESRRELLAHVSAVRDSLAAALDGVDLAVRETVEAVEGPSLTRSIASHEASPTAPTARRARRS